MTEQEALATVTKILELLKSKNFTIKGARIILTATLDVIQVPANELEQTSPVVMPTTMKWKGALPSTENYELLR